MDEGKYAVYKHTLKHDGRVYIGQTSDIDRRWMNDGVCYSGCPCFFENIKKYGWDAFDHSIIFDGLYKTEADIIERVLIRKYDSTNPKKGFNMSAGNGAVMDCDSRLKRYDDKFNRKVVQYTLGGVKIKEFESVKDASTETNNDIYAIIYCCTEGCNYFTCGGFRWAFDGEKPKEMPINYHGKAVRQISPTGKMVAQYSTMTEAAKATNINTAYISQVCSGKRHDAGGYLWEYVKKGE